MSKKAKEFNITVVEHNKPSEEAINKFRLYITKLMNNKNNG